MAFEYEYENPETGECETLEIEYTISLIVYGNWNEPPSGGECEFTATNEAGFDITNDLSEKVCDEIVELCYTDNSKYED